MRLGYSLGSVGGISAEPSVYVELAQAAERLGYESVWSAEAFGTDPLGLLGWIAAQTADIRLGAGVLQISARSAVTAAMSAATLAQVSGGRFKLGLGTSGPKVVEGWHGQSYGRPLTRMRDYVAVLRMALAGEPVSRVPVYLVRAEGDRAGWRACRQLACRAPSAGIGGRQSSQSGSVPGPTSRCGNCLTGFGMSRPGWSPASTWACPRSSAWPELGPCSIP